MKKYKTPSNRYVHAIGVPIRDVPALDEVQATLIARSGINISRSEAVGWCIRNSLKYFDTIIESPAATDADKKLP